MREATPRRLAAGQIRSLRAMREKLLKMSAEWDGVDQFSMTTLEDLADRCEVVATEIHPPVADLKDST